MIVTLRDKLGVAHEGTIDMNNIRRAKEFMSQERFCPVYGKKRYFYRFYKEFPFSNNNMSRLANALENPNKRSFPKNLRRIEQTDIHQRTEKALQAPELQNCVTSGYNYGTINWDKFKVLCSNENLPINVDTFIDRIIKDQVLGNVNMTTGQEEALQESSKENATISIVNIVDFAIKMKWFYGHSENNAGNPVTIDDIGSSSNRDFIIFHCCEELELLSRDYSNDEGGDSSMAAGPQGDTGTENPDFLIQKGLAKSALHRVPLPSVCWNNPLPENTPGLLQKAFPHVCKSGDGDPYQDRPRCIREPASTWMKHYFEWFAKQPAAQKDPRCQFYIHNRDSRNEVRETTKLAIRHCGLDMENLPTNEELLKDATKRAEIEKKITSMSSKVRDSDGYWQKIG